MRVDQAIYGETHRGHGLRIASGDRRTAADLASKLDLPDTVPLGVNWSPYLSGFPFENSFVMAMTSPDPNARRSGIVFSHALICPLDEFVDIGNINPVIERLIRGPAVVGDLPSFDIHCGESTPEPSRQLAELANILTSPGKGPAVFLGVDGFEKIIASLWGKLWPEARRGLSFRLSFGPGDLVSLPVPDIICTPASLVARWPENRVVDNDPNARPVTLAAALVAGEQDGMALLTFARSIDADVSSLKRLHLLEGLYKLILNQRRTFSEKISVLRLLETLAPATISGEQLKISAVSEVAADVKVVAPCDILKLRNIQLTSYATSQEIWTSLRNWAEDLSFLSTDANELLEVVQAVSLPGAAVESWSKAICSGLRSAALQSNSDLPAAMWTWFDSNPELAVHILENVVAEEEFAELIVCAAPAHLSKLTARFVMDLALRFSWPKLLATVLTSIFELHETIKRVLTLEPKKLQESCLEIAVRTANDLELINVASEFGEPIICRLIAKRVVAHPSLIDEIDLASVFGQCVWLEALTIDPEMWAAPSSAITARNGILDSHLAGESVSLPLLSLLSNTPLADLASYPRRNELWSILPAEMEGRFRLETSQAWLTSAIEGVIRFSPEKLLQHTIFNMQGLDERISGLFKNRIQAGVAIAEALDDVSPERFQIWIQPVLREPWNLSTSDAERLGYLILKRNWTSALYALVNRFEGGANNLKPLIRVCVSMLDYWTQISLKISPISSVEKWILLADEATRLYASGPDHDGLWSRAGGQDSDLQTRGSGKARWHDALKLVQLGKNPSAKRLVNEMLSDYPHNSRLIMLEADSDFT